MPRTKQTAKKTTGGNAPRIHINNPLPPILVNRPSTVIPAAPTVSPQADDHDNVSPPLSIPSPIFLLTFYKFCYMCVNGGYLTLCDFCPRALCEVCVKTVPVPPNPKVKFVCIACHGQIFKGSQPYYVS